MQFSQNNKLFWYKRCGHGYLLTDIPTFSVYCGISISNSLLFKKVQDAQYRSKLASDLMIYHMQVQVNY